MKEECKYVYVDDDTDDIELFGIVMGDLGKPIKTFVNPLEAISTLSDGELAACIIFLDINMPQMNGIDVLQELRTQPKLQSVPIIMYSTSKSEDHINAAWKAGASLYAPKPTTMSGIKQVMEFALGINWNSFTRVRQEFVIR